MYNLTIALITRPDLRTFRAATSWAWLSWQPLTTVPIDHRVGQHRLNSGRVPAPLSFSGTPGLLT